MSVRREDIEVIENSNFFDKERFEEQHPDVALSGMSAAEHYLLVSGLIGRNPGPGFDSAAYLATYLDVAARGENPLLHFERHGRGEGRSPTPPASTGQTKEVGDVSIDVIVPVYNALADVKSCLSSLDHTPCSYSVRVLVINDGSDAETSAWLRSACETLGHDKLFFELIEHPENCGYTRAVNTGLKASDAPFVITLNSDTIVTPYWIDGLIRCLQSDPKIGIVGPLSNAASWQNVPSLYGADGKFAINALPEGCSVEEMADIVRYASRRVYPCSTFVNGFCFMIRRAVIDAVGYMDETAFPTGYGEENDFCIRAQDAGFTLAYADDTYVFHAKSKSFGSARREALSKAGNDSIKQKHGEKKFAALVARVAQTEQMDEVRRHVQEALSKSQAGVAERAVDLITKQRVLFILPVRGGGGGAHSVIQEVTAMRKLGVGAKVAVRAADLEDYMRLYGDIEDAESLFAAFTDDTLMFVAGGYDIAVATIFTSVKLLARIVENFPWIMPAYYAQDYEPMFFDEGEPLWTEAFNSYTSIPGTFLFAKTSWICRTIEEKHAVRVCKVEPSIDHEVYNLEGPRVDRPDGTICITAMIRPRTPRRGAARTMELLAKLKAQFGAQVVIRIFGCDEGSPEFSDLKSDFDFINHGTLTRPEVAALLRSANVFIDLSDYQAFGRTGLEAMACGALAVVPKAGGGSEYAIDEINALIVDTFDVEQAFEKIIRMLEDREQMAAMQLRAVETASRYSPHRAAIKELTVLAPALSAWRAQHPLPRYRSRMLLLPDEHADASLALPGQGNERLPGPYFQPQFLARLTVQVLDGESLPGYNLGDIVILQGNPRARYGTELTNWLALWKEGGGRLIYDVPTDPEISPVIDPDIVAAADVITVSAPAIRTRLINDQPAIAGKVKVIPTYLDETLWKPAETVLHDNKTLKIGYFGSEANHEDLRRIKPALEAIQDQHRVNIEVVGCYEQSDPIIGKRVGYLKRRRQPNFKQSDFVNWLKGVANWDIILVPDDVGVDLKFMRSAALGGAIVCREAPELMGLARHEENCLLVGDDVSAWEKALTRLISDKPLRQLLARNALQGARYTWTLQAHVEAYEHVVERTVDEP